MKLYATTTSERASKGQGGNEFLDIMVTGENGGELLSIRLKPFNDDGVVHAMIRKPDMQSAIWAGYLKEYNAKKQQTAKTCVCTAACGAGLGHNVM